MLLTPQHPPSQRLPTCVSARLFTETHNETIIAVHLLGVASSFSCPGSLFTSLLTLSSQGMTSSQSAQVTTSWIIGTNSQASTVSTPTVFTIGPTTSASSGSGGSASPTGNSTSTVSGSGNATSTTSKVVTSNLPTAATDVPGANGGGPGGGAPSPGAPASGGIYGPPDGYIAGAAALRSAAMLGGVGFAVGVIITFV